LKTLSDSLLTDVTRKTKRKHGGAEEEKNLFLSAALREVLGEKASVIV
jgi:hypothetical protein